MKFTENAIKVLGKRYLAKDENGNVIETPEEMLRRVARTVADADKRYNKEADIKKTEDKFFDLMASLRFLPNSPTLMNAGRPLGQLSACFVLPIEDSMEGIFDSIKNAALIHKSGGGTGFSFSRLRPKGSTVKTTGGVASGPVSFMKVFNSATEAVKQGGTRRGANMAILRVDHPDILEFIKCKEDDKEITNFNISVALTEKFMEAAIKGEDYELIDPNTKQVKGKLNAKEVFELIVKGAWTNGEPGIVFIDRMNQTNPTPKLGEIESTNPCGEQPLLPYESCNLGSINLAKMVKKVGDKYEIDYDLLERTVFDAVHFLDNVIDVNVYPLPEIERMTKLTRKIGLGVMGFADLLILLQIPYNSEEAVNLADELMKFINYKSKEASRELAKLRGPFPEFHNSIYKEGEPLRNATTTTIAPTGTISIIAGVSSGIEPLFAVAFWRNVMDNDKLAEVNYLFEGIMKERGLYSKELMDKVAEVGTIQHIEGIPDDIKRIFVTAHDITPIYHIRMQAAFQKWTDNAVSKTVNFKKETTIEDVKTVFLLAYRLGCKGVTIYRDGSREGQVINVGDKKEDDRTSRPRIRPEFTMGITEKVRIGCGNLYVTVNYDENGICEVFTNLGKAGGCPSQSEATARLVSVALRSGMDVKEIIEQLKGIRCHSTLRQMATNKEIKVLSCPDAIAKTIEKLINIKESDKVRESISADLDIRNLIETEKKEICCPECGHSITHESGCVICPNCGYSKCG
ncbi:Ribonucleoside-diphosphate reductase NrdZ [Caloramator mitchellensis]|uniref:Vitamin B12-dependent ribonucleotide reductase n=1 Tax=Caloramator mitchellensis TaxID=908809 RepID=A0A0R3JZR8_CALMK|nr:vitamin B12-dependent ribonucleotide reductase [Caloramator mitchellensis]KRQ86101.1 Ribonucleoside-diphosphate reductase NrdZ [Caloramator mitchellensis]